MNLKIYLAIYYFTVCLFPQALAQNFSNSARPKGKDLIQVNTRWLYTPFTETKVEKNLIGTKSLVRYVKMGPNYYPVAQLSLISKKNENESPDLTEIKNEWIQKAFPDLKWLIQQNKNTLTLESYWPQTNRYISVQIKKINNGHVSLVSLARVGYLKLIYKDLQDVQQALLNSFDKNNKSVSAYNFNLLNFLIQTAEAQATDPNLALIQSQLSGLIGGSNSGLVGTTTNTTGGTLTGTSTTNGLTTTSNVNLNVTGGTANTMTIIADPSAQVISQNAVTVSNNLITVSNNAVTASNNTLAASNNTVTASNNAVTASNNLVTVSQNGVTASQNIVAASQNTVKATQNIKDAVQITNDLLRDKHNAAEMAAAAAAGATLGALMTNLVISGIASGIDYVWNELLFDKTNKRIRWENFRQAREEIEKTENAAFSLEKNLDSLALSLQNLNAQDKNTDQESYGDLLENLENKRDQYLIEAQTLRVMAAKKSTQEDVQSCITQASKLEKTAQLIEKTLQFAKDNKINSKNKNDFFCQQIETYKRKLLDTEYSLNRLNTMLVAGKNEYFKFREQEIKQIEKDNNYINEQNANSGFLESDKDVTDSAIKLGKKSQSQEKDYFMEQCIAGKNEAGQYVLEVYNKDKVKNWTLSGYDESAYSNKYFDCRKIYNLLQQDKNKQNASSLEQIKKMAYAEAERSAQISSQMFHGVNIERLEADLSENRKWFEKKEIENQCYQLLGKTMSETQEKSCDRLAPKLMSLYRSHKKANDLWVNNCQSSYASAAQGANTSNESIASIIAKLRAENPN